MSTNGKINVHNTIGMNMVEIIFTEPEETNVEVELEVEIVSRRRGDYEDVDEGQSEDERMDVHDENVDNSSDTEHVSGHALEV